MKVNQLFTTTALMLAATAAVAGDLPGAPLTRAEVTQSVLAARASGTLRHAGPTAPEESTSYSRAVTAPSSLTRAQEKLVVRSARAAGELSHAGASAPEDDLAFARRHPSTSVLTRADVRAEVMQARRDGTMIPAGQGE